MKNMNSVIFLPHIMSNCGEGGNTVEWPLMLLTLVIISIILIILGILANVLHVKFSQGFSTPIYWDNIKPTVDNSLLGYICSNFSLAIICTALLIGLIAGVYGFIISL